MDGYVRPRGTESKNSTVFRVQDMKNFVERVISRIRRQIVKWFLRPELKLEWRRHCMADQPRNERPMEFAFAMKQLTRLYPLKVLDVGSGFTAWPHLMANCGFHVTAIDEVETYWKGAMFNRHYHIVNDDITKPTITGEFDLITCISVIEHIPEHQAALAGMFNLLKQGGHIILTCPYNEHRYVPNVYKLPDAGYGQNNPFICQVFSRRELDDWLESNKAKIIEQKYYEFFTGRLWTFGKRLYPPTETSREDKHHLTCLLIEKL